MSGLPRVLVRELPGLLREPPRELPGLGLPGTVGEPPRELPGLEQPGMALWPVLRKGLPPLVLPSVPILSFALPCRTALPDRTALPGRVWRFLTALPLPIQ